MDDYKNGLFYIYDKNAPTIIIFHGYRSCLYSDSCGGFQEARRCGFNVLLVHQRGHGLSDGNVITFGMKERYDVLSWIDFVKKNYGVISACYHFITPYVRILIKK